MAKRVVARFIKNRGRTFPPVIARAGYSDIYLDRYEGASGFGDTYEGSY